MYRFKSSTSAPQRPTVVQNSSCEVCRVYGSPSSRTPSTRRDVILAFGRDCNCGENYKRQQCIGLGE